jgi:hypothetical protein
MSAPRNDGSLERETAWAIVDTLPAGALTLEQCADLAARIAGSLREARVRAEVEAAQTADFKASLRLLESLKGAVAKAMQLRQRVDKMHKRAGKVVRS